ncbi:MAG: hypothetical protein KAH95_00450 [Spirochaetales bacterium]|nr:hypothetical protein [Spirochaetales bacterium]
MLKIGDYNILKIKRMYHGGCFLIDGEDTREDSPEVYIDDLDIPDDMVPGEELNVFVYNDSKESLSATLNQPHAIVDEFAALKVVSIEDFGVFLDWGIKKDLFLPNRRQIHPIIEDSVVVLRLVLDYEKQGVVGDTDLEIYFNRDTSALEEDQEVDLLVYGSTPLGIMVIVDNEYPGLVYRTEVFKEPETGDKLTGWISKIREDGKLDISLKRKGYYAVIDSSESLFKLIKDNNGFLDLHDKSSPEDIKEKLGMSKKLFKKIAGGLYRDGLITIESDGLRSVEKKIEP